MSCWKNKQHQIKRHCWNGQHKISV